MYKIFSKQKYYNKTIISSNIIPSILQRLFYYETADNFIDLIYKFLL
jgi:hypothetical protein